MKTSAICILLVAVSFCGWAQLRLHGLLSDNAVLQRDHALQLTGWASPNQTVQLEFRGSKYSSTADESGKWTITLSPQKAGGPHELRFSTSREQVVMKNVLFGDVWVCSGQSNMEMLMNNVKDKYAEVIAKSANPNIRHFTIAQQYDFKQPHSDLNAGDWKEATPQTVLQFSAVAYFFAKDIYEKYGVPIGLLNASLGGSPAESWMSEDALKNFPNHLAEAVKFQNDNLIAEIEKSDRDRSNAWYAAVGSKDEGIKANWRAENFDDRSWLEMPVPGYWADEKLINGNGVVWYRRTFEISESFAAQPARALLGRIVDQDSVFINGQFIGTTSYQYPQRRYTIKPGVLKAGRNTIAIKVINQSGKGGFVADKPYMITAGKDTINLIGKWKYQQGATASPLASQTFIRWKPMGLYNAMIAPIVWYPIKGVIWYQGESNVGRPQEYKTLLPALIENWRDKWHENFPFIFVQLPNFQEAREQPGESYWAALRQAQLETLAVSSRTGMAVTIDLGEWNDIHPLDKASVGKRLALNAMKLAYGDKKIVSQGPQVAKAIFGDNEIEITFYNAKEGLVAKGGSSVNHVAISADGKTFEWASTRIEGSKLHVWHESIKDPVVVRYAWADNPDTANLYNKQGLPASPFELRKK